MSTTPRRLVGAERREEDLAETSLRPQRLSEFIGQQQARANLQVFIDAARARIDDLKKQQASRAPGTVGSMLRCEDLTDRKACELDTLCSWADNRKQCERKSGSLAEAMLSPPKAESQTPCAACDTAN